MSIPVSMLATDLVAGVAQGPRLLIEIALVHHLVRAPDHDAGDVAVRACTQSRVQRLEALHGSIVGLAPRLRGRQCASSPDRSHRSSRRDGSFRRGGRRLVTTWPWLRGLPVPRTSRSTNAAQR